MDSVAVIFVSLFILIKMNLIESIGTSLSLASTDPFIYLVQAFITTIISFGVIIGAIAGGQISDKIMRKLSVYLAYLITTVSLLLMLIPAAWIILLCFSILVGCAVGWRQLAMLGW